MFVFKTILDNKLYKLYLALKVFLDIKGIHLKYFVLEQLMVATILNGT